MSYLFAYLLVTWLYLWVQGFCVWSLLCYAVIRVLAGVTINHIDEEERAGCFTLYLSSQCLVNVSVLWFLAMPWVGLHCYVVVFYVLLVNAVIFSGKYVAFFLIHVHITADCTVTIA